MDECVNLDTLAAWMIRQGTDYGSLEQPQRRTGGSPNILPGTARLKSRK